MEEEFKICFETYEVSNLGNVRRKLTSGDYKSVECSVGNKGYKYFQLKRDGKRRNYFVHHLVAEQFIGKRPQTSVVDHIDRNPLNNKIENLRYVSHKENLQNTDKFITDIEVKEGETRKKAYSKYYLEKNRDVVLSKKREYYYKNADDIKKKTKEYKEKNKEKIKESNREVITCECGSTSTRHHLARHRKSKRHLAVVK